MCILATIKHKCRTMCKACASTISSTSLAPVETGQIWAAGSFCALGHSFVAVNLSLWHLNVTRNPSGLPQEQNINNDRFLKETQLEKISKTFGEHHSKIHITLPFGYTQFSDTPICTFKIFQSLKSVCHWAIPNKNDINNHFFFLAKCLVLRIAI